MSHHILAFDSGIGGLGVVKSLQCQLASTALRPSIDYLADNLIFPYGEQPDDFLINRIVELIGQAIQTIQPDLIIIACNTASTIALDALRKAYPTMPFVGCVPPIRWAARISQTKHIGLLATRATVQRPYLQALKDQFAADCELIAYGSPILAKLAEQVFRHQPYNHQQIAEELNILLTSTHAAHIDTICLGCTHYTFILDILRKLSPPHIQWLDPAPAVAKHAIDLMLQKSIPFSSTNVKKNKFYYTSLPSGDTALLKQISPMGYNEFTLFNS